MRWLWLCQQGASSTLQITTEVSTPGTHRGKVETGLSITRAKRGVRDSGDPSAGPNGRPGLGPRTEQELEISGGHRMTQGGRLLVIFSRGSPLMALRMASMRSFS